MRLANEIGRAPVIVLVCATSKGQGAMASVIPSVQNLLLAARALGIGGTITTLHQQVEERVHRLLGIPETAQVVYCIPLNQSQGGNYILERWQRHGRCKHQCVGSGL